jgi:tetratricopeptide (TPR) repeat protein
MAKIKNMVSKSNSLTTFIIGLYTAAGLLFVSFFIAPAHAASLKDLYGSCFSSAGKPRVKEVFPDSSQNLLINLARKPELMNLDYLQYIIGRPDNERTQRGRTEKTYHWLDNVRQIKYELRQTELIPGQISESTFIMNLQDTGLTYNKLESILGGNFQRFYNNSSQPCVRTSLAPYTYVSFAAAQNTFRLGQAEIVYQGPALNKPAWEDMEAAREHHKANTLNAHTNGSWQELQQNALRQVYDNPQDPSCHMFLAKALAKQGKLNIAIDEYEKAMALSGPATAVYNQCLADLREFKVIRDTPQYRDIIMANKGQHLRAGSEKKQEWETFHNGNHESNSGLVQSGSNIGM